MGRTRLIIYKKTTAVIYHYSHSYRGSNTRFKKGIERGLVLFIFMGKTEKVVKPSIFHSSWTMVSHVTLINHELLLKKGGKGKVTLFWSQLCKNE